MPPAQPPSPRAASWRPARSWQLALLLTLCLRLGLTVWAGLITAVSPPLATDNAAVRPYLGETVLDSGLSHYLLGPWQRFDTNRYARIARQGYAAPADSVFPPLYPLLIRLVSSLIPGERSSARLIAGLLISTVAYGLALAYLHQWVERRWDSETATRTLIYLTLFPTSFFFMAAYAESLFLLWVVLALWTADNGRFGWAGLFGAAAALTRLTGWVLLLVLAAQYWEQNRHQSRSLRAHIRHGWGVLLPGAGLGLFLLGRWWLGLPGLTAVYASEWHQITSFPGRDILTGIRMFQAGSLSRSPFTLGLDYGCLLLLLVTAAYSWRRLGIVPTLYQGLMLFFILLPASDLKPLYSFSRYTLLFLPTFVMLGQLGKNSWWQRLILYPGLLLLLFLAGQFFWWGWVA